MELELPTGRIRPPWGDQAVEYHIGSPSEISEGQARLVRAGAPPPLEHRAAWLERLETRPYVFVVVTDESGEWTCAFPVTVASSTALPGHRILRVERFAAAASGEARRAGVWSFLELADTMNRVIRAHLQVYTRRAEVRADVGDIASQLGFQRPETVNPYRRTVVKDLTPEEEEIFASFSSSCRRNVRAPDKKGFDVRVVEDMMYVERCQALLNESYARTGASAPSIDWRPRIELARDHPELFSIVGTFQPEVEGPEALVAYGCGRHCGEYAEYSTAASTRELDSNVALTYAPVWRLMQWARKHGASWFDLGGISEGGEEDPDDPLGGISDFKRYFTDEVAEVGDEWIVEPLGIRSRVARTLSEGARWIQDHVS